MYIHIHTNILTAVLEGGRQRELRPEVVPQLGVHALAMNS